MIHQGTSAPWLVEIDVNQSELLEATATHDNSQSQVLVGVRLAVLIQYFRLDGSETFNSFEVAEP